MNSVVAGEIPLGKQSLLHRNANIIFMASNPSALKNILWKWPNDPKTGIFILGCQVINKIPYCIIQKYFKIYFS